MHLGEPAFLSRTSLVGPSKSHVTVDRDLSTDLARWGIDWTIERPSFRCHGDRTHKEDWALLLPYIFSFLDRWPKQYPFMNPTIQFGWTITSGCARFAPRFDLPALDSEILCPMHTWWNSCTVHFGRAPSPYNVSGTTRQQGGVAMVEDGEMAEVWEGGEHSEAPAMPGRCEEWMNVSGDSICLDADVPMCRCNKVTCVPYARCHWAAVISRDLFELRARKPGFKEAF